jgi:hypothetical protein
VADDPSLLRLPSGRRLIKYPPGCAIAWLPFYLAAEGASAAFSLDTSPYGPVHQGAVAAAATTYLLIGLVVLYRIAVRRATPAAAAVALFGLVFGTNLFHYATFDASFSHVYSFCAISVWTLSLFRLGETPSWKTGFAFGLALGAVFLLRNTNLVVLLFAVPVLRASPVKRSALLATAPWALLAFALCVLPQLVYSRWGAGTWLLSGYLAKSEGFANWRSPRLFFVLFSPARGFFFWAPLMLVPLVAALRGAIGREASLGRGILLVLAAQALIAGSWWAPGYGGGFGHRAFIDILPLLFLAFPPVVDAVLGARPLARLAALGAMGLAVVYTWKLMIAYWIGRLSIEAPTLRQWGRALRRDVWW